jgi:hypothetical protein
MKDTDKMFARAFGRICSLASIFESLLGAAELWNQDMDGMLVMANGMNRSQGLPPEPRSRHHLIMTIL